MINKTKFSHISKEEMEKQIPKGMYCDYLVKDKNGKHISLDGSYKFNIKQCPFWDIDKDLPKQMNGYCHYLEKSDMDMMNEVVEHGIDVWSKESDKTVHLNKKEIMEQNFPIEGFSLLWDSCKECGINTEIEDTEIE